MTLITGNTYPVKDQLRNLGGQWDKVAKGWNVPDERADEARAIMDGAGPVARATQARRYARYGSTYTRFSSGAEVFTNKKGSCEDAPCCGCCS